jgi:four helix bundle protein
MLNVQKVQQTIQQRSFDFAVRIVKLVQALPRDTAGFVVGRQIGRSGTSICANAEEARAAYSRADFSHAMNIARKEACETHYWLRLIAATGLISRQRLAPMIQEAEELIRILTATVKRVRST